MERWNSSCTSFRSKKRNIQRKKVKWLSISQKKNERCLKKKSRILELGAAAAVPSFISAINDAECVVITDWPDPGLITNIQRNAQQNMPGLVDAGKIKVVGYQWGQDTADLLAALPDTSRKFDVIFLADLIFNHTEHNNLLKTCLSTLNDSGSLYVYFTHHVVKWADRDLKFFEIASSESFGFDYELLESVRASAMFPDDVGDLDVRETVHCYRLWKKQK
jgi:EEF1A N-terminal glycine/lysine methyltransferase